MDWELDKRSKKCALCRKEFETGGAYQSVLNLEENMLQSGPEADSSKDEQPPSKDNPLKNSGRREEYCPSCWEIKKQEVLFDYFWQGRYIEPPEPGKSPSRLYDITSIQELFFNTLTEAQNLSLSDEERIEKNGIAYLLALFLERKRLLKHKKDSVIDGVNCALYEEPKTGIVHTIRHPLFSAQWVREYQHKIALLLNIPPKAEKEKV
ncbi:MAG: hypothetical protein JW774_06125 [Candidatus Aureabacteria bacterium]|nr:hypothetical protein [Candidatus Auribacterota bacterium]